MPIDRYEQHQLPTYVMTRDEKRAVLSVLCAAMEIKGCTLKTDSFMGVQVALAVLAYRQHWKPMLEDRLEFFRLETHDVQPEPGWCLRLYYAASPDNSPEVRFTDPWAVDEVGHWYGVMRALQHVPRWDGKLSRDGRWV